MTAYLVAHRRHVLSPDPTALDSNEQPDSVVFADDENVRVTYTARLDSWSGSAAVDVLDALPLRAVRLKHSNHIRDVEHDMEDGGSLEERGRTQGHSWDASGDGDIRLRRTRRDLDAGE